MRAARGHHPSCACTDIQTHETSARDPHTDLLELRLLRDAGGAGERDAVLVDAEELVDHGLVRPLRQPACDGREWCGGVKVRAQQERGTQTRPTQYTPPQPHNYNHVRNSQRRHGVVAPVEDDERGALLAPGRAAEVEDLVRLDGLRDGGGHLYVCVCVSVKKVRSTDRPNRPSMIHPRIHPTLKRRTWRAAGEAAW